MDRVSIVFGLLLCGLSAVGMIASITKDPVQFIPIMIGIPVLFCGVVSLNPHRRRLAMRLAATVTATGGVLGIVMVAFRGTPSQSLSEWTLSELATSKLGRSELELHQAALLLMGTMTVLCWTLTGLQIFTELRNRSSKLDSEPLNIEPEKLVSETPSEVSAVQTSLDP